MALQLVRRMRLFRDRRLLLNSGLFDGGFYLERSPGVAKGGINPLQHYLNLGGFEGRDPHPLFDSDWYLQQNPDVASSGVQPPSRLFAPRLEGRPQSPPAFRRCLLPKAKPGCGQGWRAEAAAKVFRAELGWAAGARRSIIFYRAGWARGFQKQIVGGALG